MRRLFFTFADGPPGIGLLLLRLVTGISLVTRSLEVLSNGPTLEFGILAACVIGLGGLLIAGFGTPIAGGVLALGALWSLFAEPADRCCSVFAAVLGVALLLLGPGAWSVDARLFGWKRL